MSDREGRPEIYTSRTYASIPTQRREDRFVHALPLAWEGKRARLFLLVEILFVREIPPTSLGYARRGRQKYLRGRCHAPVMQTEIRTIAVNVRRHRFRLSLHTAPASRLPRPCRQKNYDIFKSSRATSARTLRQGNRRATL